MLEKIWETLCLLREPCQNSFFRVALEILLLALVLRYAFSQNTQEKKKDMLTEEEMEEVIRDWEPKEMGIEIKEAETGATKYVLSSYNPFMFNSPFDRDACPVEGLPGETPEKRDEKKNELKKTIDVYGVGTCGPRGFYGTLDLHLELEEALAEALGVESVVLYAHALLATESVIKCFCKKNDVIFYDHRASIGVRRGVQAAKSKAIPYTSLQDLDEKLSLEKEGRKFIITEGVFEETGETVDLQGVVMLKRKYRGFLVLDESVSIPMLGTRGCVGFFGGNPKDVDIWIGSLAGGYGGAGGFAGSTREISEHQRLSSLAYCFSASMPACLTHLSLMNLQSVVVWEKMYEKGVRALGEEERSEESEYEFTYQPEIEFPIMKQVSPKFAKRFKREKNFLINTEAVGVFVKKFNKMMKELRVSVRARNDEYTSIVRIVVLEEFSDRLLVVQKIKDRLKAAGIWVRLGEFPDPSLIINIDNSITQKTAEEIASEFSHHISEVYREEID